MIRSFSRSTDLGTVPAEVWAWIASVEGLRDEFRPWFRLSFNAPFEALTPDRVPIGRRVARVWVWLLGVVPVDYDDITLVSLDPGRGFHERSPMLLNRTWTHRRTLVAAGPGCRVTDEVSFEPRLALLGGPYLMAARRIFRHRHRRLLARFGPPA